jgi:hypothetical protein
MALRTDISSPSIMDDIVISHTALMLDYPDSIVMDLSGLTTTFRTSVLFLFKFQEDMPDFLFCV